MGNTVINGGRALASGFPVLETPPILLESPIKHLTLRILKSVPTFLETFRHLQILLPISESLGLCDFDPGAVHI